MGWVSNKLRNASGNSPPYPGSNISAMFWYMLWNHAVCITNKGHPFFPMWDMSIYRTTLLLRSCGSWIWRQEVLLGEGTKTSEGMVQVQWSCMWRAVGKGFIGWQPARQSTQLTVCFHTWAVWPSNWHWHLRDEQCPGSLDVCIYSRLKGIETDTIILCTHCSWKLNRSVNSERED